jgi:hypothetical protein
MIKKLLNPDPKKRLGAEAGAAELKSAFLSNSPLLKPQANTALQTTHSLRALSGLSSET